MAPHPRFLRAIGLTLCVTALLSVSAAEANDRVDEGRKAYESGELEAALTSFADAERSASLETEDLVQLLTTRVLVHYALEQREPMVDDLYVLAAVDPLSSLPEEVPPDLRRLFNRFRQEMPGPIEVRLETSDREGGGARITPKLSNDIHEVVREVHVYVRTDGLAWKRATDGAEVDATAVDCYAEAIGPGGVTIASFGSSEHPNRCQGDLFDGGAGDDQTGIPTWIWVGGGAVLVGIAAVIIALSLDSGGDEGAQPGVPVVDF